MSGNDERRNVIGDITKISETWKAFLDSLIESKFCWEDCLDCESGKSFFEGIEIIHRIFEQKGVYEDG